MTETHSEDAKLGPGTVGAIHYALRTAQGEELETIPADAPLIFLFGAGALVPGLEKALEGQRAGANLSVTVAPAEAFGENDPARVYYVPRSNFPDSSPPEPGTMMGAEDANGRPVTFWVTGVEDERVVVNENHPLAGMTLVYDVTVAGVRAATAEEISSRSVASPE